MITSSLKSEVFLPRKIGCQVWFGVESCKATLGGGQVVLTSALPS